MDICNLYFRGIDEFDPFQSPVQQEHTDLPKRKLVKRVKRVPSVVREEVPAHPVVLDI